MPTDSEIMSRRDSWPPTQVRLEQTGSKEAAPSSPRLEDIDDDPFTYFLTPPHPPPGEDDIYDEDDFGADLDAGIEDPNHPQEMVRSVSPSSLEGLRRPDQDRPSSPEYDSGTSLSLDEDDDDIDSLTHEEDHIRFSPQHSRLTSFRDIDVDGMGARPESPVFGRNTNALLSPASFPAPQQRGRVLSPGWRGRSRSLSARTRPTHLWREPSPDVWSIEEETEEELASEFGSSPDITTHGVDIMASKPKKKVRFLLPGKEE